MDKTFINIKSEDFYNAVDNLNIFYKYNHTIMIDVNVHTTYYIKISDEISGAFIFSSMKYFYYIKSLFKMSSVVDYYEWYKENETLITASKFGLY